MCPFFPTSLNGCGFQHLIGNKSSPSFFVLGSIQTIFLLLTLIFYFFTLWSIFKLHHKTEFEEREQSDESKQRKVRKKKQMLKSMKVVGLILLVLLVSIIPALVVSFRGLSHAQSYLFCFYFRIRIPRLTLSSIASISKNYLKK